MEVQMVHLRSKKVKGKKGRERMYYYLGNLCMVVDRFID
jgi:hypothetical protein